MMIDDAVVYTNDLLARRRMTSNKMKRMKQSGKDADELEEDNEELFAELGTMLTTSLCLHVRASKVVFCLCISTFIFGVLFLT